MRVAGVDIGSLTAKAVIFEGERIVATSLVPTGHDSRLAGERAVKAVMEEAGVPEGGLDYTVATGYGRVLADYANEKITEITCHARGAHFAFPGARTVIDLGGQDSKVISVDARGRVTDFVMNDKCAAGTGRFLEVMAAALEIELDQLGEVSLISTDPASISSVCTVFAESEVVSRVAEGVEKHDIVAGAHQAIASRIFAMASRLRIDDRVIMTGGVAMNRGVVAALEERFSKRIQSPRFPQHNGAIGAAVIAAERVIAGG